MRNGKNQLSFKKFQKNKIFTWMRQSQNDDEKLFRVCAAVKQSVDEKWKEL